MSNYKEKDLSGTSWIRCSNIIIENPHSSLKTIPSATFLEETIIDLNDGNYSISPYKRKIGVSPATIVENGILRVDVSPTAIFNLYDPITGEKTGATMTHAELYAIMYSAYRTEAEKSDTQLEEIKETIKNTAIVNANNSIETANT